MLLVILQHCISSAGGGESRLSVVILSFHMPLFFYASGLVYRRKEPGQLFAGRMASLLSPVVLYSVINVLMRICLNIVHKDDYYSALAFAGFWFLLSLLYISIFQYALDKLILDKIQSDKIRMICCCVLALVAVGIGNAYSKIIVGKEVSIATALVGYGFYMLGIGSTKVLPILNRKTERFLPRILIAMAGVVLLAILFFTAKANTPVFMYLSDYGNAALFTLNAIIGILSLVCISWAMKRNRAIEFFGKNSLVILITHFPVHHICVKAASMVSSNLWVTAILGFVTTCAIETLVVIIVNRYIPALTGKIRV